MKRFLLILASVFLLGLAAYASTYWLASATVCSMPQTQDSLVWLTREFHLTAEQAARITKLDEAYRPKCAVLCAEITSAQATLKKQVLLNQKLTPEVQSAMAREAAVRMECHEAMLDYCYAVSQAMAPEEGRRYLKLMQVCLTEDGKPAGASPASCENHGCP